MRTALQERVSPSISRARPVTPLRVEVDGKFFRHGAERFPFHGVTYGTFKPRASDGARFPDRARIACDLDAMVRGVQRLFETVLTGRMRQHIAYPFLPPSDSPTEADIAEHLRRTTQTLYHPVGTCAMGLGEQAVVDPQLRLRGLERLRVIDSSIMPRLISSNTNAASIMIGEKGSDLIKGNRAQPLAA